MTAYYNENDPKAAAWLRQLISDGLIAPGVVDERSISDVTPEDLSQYVQCHFFAGIGGWSYALRMAGWPDDRPVWTGSCPCQPFSKSGEVRGFADERHLWPHWFHLIKEQAPERIFGEQTASKKGFAWLDLVSDDLESQAYAIASADLCVAGFGGPHIRQRLWFGAARMGNTNDTGSQRLGQSWSSSHSTLPTRTDGLVAGLVVPNDGAGRKKKSSPLNGFWRDADWLYCIDGKWRPVEPGTYPLAYGIPDRVGLIRGYGNAIAPQVAAEFIQAYEEALNDVS